MRLFHNLMKYALRCGTVQIMKNPHTIRRAKMIDIIIGRRIREARQEKGMSQPDLASAVGISYQQIQKYERAANRVSVSTLLVLCEALGISVDEFLKSLAAKAKR